MNFKENNIERVILVLQTHYTNISSKKIIEGTNEILEDSGIKKCRFCQKTHHEVSFKSKAHAIPHFIGNNSLFSANECDTCNSTFQKYESEMANFMLPLHSTFGVKGKRKIPKLNEKGSVVIEHKPEYISFTNVDPLFLLNYNSNSSNFLNTRIPSFVPEFIYRCLIKMALSILPESKLPEYKRTIAWLLDKDQNSDISPEMMLTVYPLTKVYNPMICNIFERKDIKKVNFPYSIFSVSYSVFHIYTYIPFTLGDEYDLTVPVIPSYLDTLRKSETGATSTIIRLTSKNREKNGKLIWTLLGGRLQ